MDKRESSDKLLFMPKHTVSAKSLETLAAETHYAPEAFVFVQDGLTFTAEKLYGKKTGRPRRHITGQELAEGLRELAIENWGLMARCVLEKWGIVSTMDFGRIVYALISAKMMSKSADDSLEDFRNVYDFRKAFDGAYRIKPELVTT
jgi:uncharacterized repeat protein (TIGR04138 family)